MKLAPLLELASSPAFRGADESVGASLERLAALNAVTNDPGVLHAICSATFCVHAFHGSDRASPASPHDGIPGSGTSGRDASDS
jgi:hypothetical protein